MASFYPPGSVPFLLSLLPPLLSFCTPCLPPPTPSHDCYAGQFVSGVDGGRWGLASIPEPASPTSNHLLLLWVTLLRKQSWLWMLFFFPGIYLFDILPWVKVYNAYVYSGNCRNFRRYRWVLLQASCVMSLALSYIKPARLETALFWCKRESDVEEEWEKNRSL